VNQVAVGVAVAVLASAAQADTIYVDIDNCPGPGSGTKGDPYCSIQTAINNAVDTDEIVVAPGTYVEAINFLGKAVTLRSDLGPHLTTIDGGGESFYRTVVTCDSGEGPDTILHGFTITGAYEFSTGGGMSNLSSSPTVTNCTFSQNLAAHGGGMSNDNGSKPTVINCTFSGNWAHRGGGMFNHDSDPTVIGCTFSGNFSVLHGGGMWNIGSNATVINCTFNGNASELIGGGMMINAGNPILISCIFWGNAPEEVWDWSDSLVVTYSNVQGGWPGQGNIGADPLFVRQSDSDCCLPNHYTTGCADPACEAIVCEAEPYCCDEEWGAYCPALAIVLCGDLCSRDLHLQPGSPCIDAGDNTAVPEGITTDLDGNPRFVDDPDTMDTGYGDPPLVDMGAYEYQGLPCPWDLSGNGNVDVVDLLMVIGSWGPCAGCPADFNEDGLVNVVDLLALIANFGPCPGVPCVWDVNGDGVVGQSDLQQVLDNFGDCDGCAEDVNGDGTVNGQDAAAVATHFGPCP
jgi:hypothetical protein